VIYKQSPKLLLGQLRKTVPFLGAALKLFLTGRAVSISGVTHNLEFAVPIQN
jgi:hypothetical protein